MLPGKALAPSAGARTAFQSEKHLRRTFVPCMHVHARKDACVCVRTGNTMRGLPRIAPLPQKPSMLPCDCAPRAYAQAFFAGCDPKAVEHLAGALSEAATRF